MKTRPGHARVNPRKFQSSIGLMQCRENCLDKLIISAGDMYLMGGETVTVVKYRPVYVITVSIFFHF